MSTLELWRVTSIICLNSGRCWGSRSPGPTPYRLIMTSVASALDSLFLSLASAPDFFWVVEVVVEVEVVEVVGVEVEGAGMSRDSRDGILGPAPERSVD